MKVYLTETGGWTNVRTGCTVDTATLPDPVAAALLQALAQPHLFIEHVQAPDARDARTVSIEIECGDRWKRTSFSEAAPPADARVVLEILRPYCKPMPLRQG